MADKAAELIDAYHQYMTSLQSKLKPSDLFCSICRLYKLKDTNTYNKTIDVYNHIIKDHKKIVEEASNLYALKLDSTIQLRNDFFRKMFNIQNMDMKHINTNSLTFKYATLLFNVQFHHSFKLEKEENDAPGSLSAKDYDYRKYLTTEMMDETINLVEDHVQERSIQQLHESEPGAKYILYDCFCRQVSVEALAREIWDNYESSKITKKRKVQIQYMIDLISIEVKNMNFVYGMLKPKSSKLNPHGSSELDINSASFEAVTQTIEKSWRIFKSKVRDGAPQLSDLEVFGSFQNIALERYKFIETDYIDCFADFAKNCHVEVHGSYATGLASMDSNLDLALFGTDPYSQHWMIYNSFKILHNLFKQLENTEDFTVEFVSTCARVTTLRIKHKCCPFTTNLTIGGIDTAYQTLILRNRVESYGSFAPMVIYLKKWSKSNNLNLLNESVNYILTLMSHFFLHLLTCDIPAKVSVKYPNPKDIKTRLNIGKVFYLNCIRDDDYATLGSDFSKMLNFYGDVNMTASGCFEYDLSGIFLAHEDHDGIMDKSMLWDYIKSDPFILLFGSDNIANDFTKNLLNKFRLHLRKLAFKLTYRKSCDIDYNIF